MEGATKTVGIRGNLGVKKDKKVLMKGRRDRLRKETDTRIALVLCKVIKDKGKYPGLSSDTPVKMLWL